MLLIKKYSIYSISKIEPVLKMDFYFCLVPGFTTDKYRVKGNEFILLPSAIELKNCSL